MTNWQDNWRIWIVILLNTCFAGTTLAQCGCSCCGGPPPKLPVRSKQTIPNPKPEVPKWSFADRNCNFGHVSLEYCLPREVVERRIRKRTEKLSEAVIQDVSETETKTTVTKILKKADGTVVKTVITTAKVTPTDLEITDRTVNMPKSKAAETEEHLDNIESDNSFDEKDDDDYVKNLKLKLKLEEKKRENDNLKKVLRGIEKVQKKENIDEEEVVVNIVKTKDSNDITETVVTTTKTTADKTTTTTTTTTITTSIPSGNMHSLSDITIDEEATIIEDTTTVTKTTTKTISMPLTIDLTSNLSCCLSKQVDGNVSSWTFQLKGLMPRVLHYCTDTCLYELYGEEGGEEYCFRVSDPRCVANFAGIRGIGDSDVIEHELVKRRKVIHSDNEIKKGDKKLNDKSIEDGQHDTERSRDGSDNIWYGMSDGNKCCLLKQVMGEESLAGMYILDGMKASPYRTCTDNCEYVKVGDTKQDKFCFTDGDMEVACHQEIPSLTDLRSLHATQKSLPVVIIESFSKDKSARVNKGSAVEELYEGQTCSAREVMCGGKTCSAVDEISGGKTCPAWERVYKGKAYPALEGRIGGDTSLELINSHVLEKETSSALGKYNGKKTSSAVKGIYLGETCSALEGKYRTLYLIDIGVFVSDKQKTMKNLINHVPRETHTNFQLTIPKHTKADSEANVEKIKKEFPFKLKKNFHALLSKKQDNSTESTAQISTAGLPVLASSEGRNQVREILPKAVFNGCKYPEPEL